MFHFSCEVTLACVYNYVACLTHLETRIASFSAWFGMGVLASVIWGLWKEIAFFKWSMVSTNVCIICSHTVTETMCWQCSIKKFHQHFECVVNKIFSTISFICTVICRIYLVAYFLFVL